MKALFVLLLDQLEERWNADVLPRGPAFDRGRSLFNVVASSILLIGGLFFGVATLGRSGDPSNVVALVVLALFGLGFVGFFVAIAVRVWRR